MSNYPTFSGDTRDGFDYIDYLIKKGNLDVNKNTIFDLIKVKWETGNDYTIKQYTPNYYDPTFTHLQNPTKNSFWDIKLVASRLNFYEGELKSLNPNFKMTVGYEGEVAHFVATHMTGSPDTHLGEAKGSISELMMLGTTAVNRAVFANLQKYFKGENLKDAINIITSNNENAAPKSIFEKEEFSPKRFDARKYELGQLSSLAFVKSEINLTNPYNHYAQKIVKDNFKTFFNPTGVFAASFPAAYLHNRLKITHRLDLTIATPNEIGNLPIKALHVSPEEKEFLVGTVAALAGESKKLPSPNLSSNIYIAAATMADMDIAKLDTSLRSR